MLEMIEMFYLFFPYFGNLNLSFCLRKYLEKCFSAHPFFLPKIQIGFYFVQKKNVSASYVFLSQYMSLLIHSFFKQKQKP